ncbi:hypothetical protein, partial [Glutamicibacter arilaitensis]|uniref:hypothetical protein n=1 Tax=Glutamicibacter arilaitensis TaxID=256701 RepID=UPI003F8DB7CC
MSFDHRTEVNWAKFVSCLGFMLAAVRVLPALGPVGLMGANGRGLEVKAKMFSLRTSVTVLPQDIGNT